MTSTRKSPVVSAGRAGRRSAEVRPARTSRLRAPRGNRGAGVTVARNRFAGRSLAALLAVALAGVAGCDLRETGNGVYAERTLHVADFDGVRVQDGIDAVITVAPGLAQTVTLTGDENIVENDLHASVEPEGVGSAVVQVLHVWASPSFVPVIPPRVVVGRPSLAAACAAGGSAVTLARPSGSTVVGGPLVTELSGATLDARDYPVSGALVDLDAGSTALLHSDGQVTGSVSGDSTLDNTFGAGPCLVTTTAGAKVLCN